MGAKSYEFSINSATLPGFHQSDAMSFRLAYSSWECCKQACEYVANENLMNFIWLGKPMLPPNGFGASGSDALPPPPKMTIQ
jgi:hypothetical protein